MGDLELKLNVEEMDMNALNRVTPLVVLLLAGCNLVVIADGEVDWSLQAGVTCQQYGISTWQVNLSGPDAVAPLTTTCIGSGGYATPLFSAAEGTYTATVRALSSAGAQIGVSRTITNTLRSSYGITHFDVGTFSSADLNPSFVCGNGVCESSAGESCQNCAADCTCGTCGNSVCDAGESCSTCPSDCSCSTAHLHALWSINGTEDGTDNGLSWDSCTEVGAQYVRITIDSSTTDLPCGGSTKSAMNTASAGGDISVGAGSHTISAQLLDSGKNGLTSIASTTGTFAVGNTLTQAFNFDWDAFVGAIKTSTTGVYQFTTSFEGKSCSQVSWVKYEMALLSLGGSAVTPAPQVCDSYANCFSADGNSTNACVDSSNVQKMSAITWGSYKLKLMGTLTDKTACYSVDDGAGNKEVDILIGAGTENPIVPHDMKKIYPAASGCL
jgi:hypothetical protein